jgi:hypothetical protein
MKTLIRLHQVLLVLAILSGCYEPSVRDCTVSCSGTEECAGGQVCGPQGFCVDEGVTCTNAATDAGPTMVTLRVQISGPGKVDVTGAGSCGAGGQTDCMIPVPRGAVTVTAIQSSGEHPFDKWTTMNCANQGAVCSFTAQTASFVGVKFK